MNTCPHEPRWLVIAGQIVSIEHGPAMVVAAACDHCVLGIKAFMRERSYDAAALLGGGVLDVDEPIVCSIEAFDALDQVVGDYWLYESVAS